MSKKRTLIILGIFIALLPFLGIPRSFREVLSALAGLAVAVFAFLLHRKGAYDAKEEKNGVFSQNGIKESFRPDAVENSRVNDMNSINHTTVSSSPTPVQNQNETPAE